MKKYLFIILLVGSFSFLSAYKTGDTLHYFLDPINVFSTAQNKNSQISFKEDNILEIIIAEKFVGERGRVNCSLRETNGFWRWLGIQYGLSGK